MTAFPLHWRLLDEQFVVYNSGSGHTHILDPVAALIIHRIIEQPSETDELIRQIASLLNLDATEEVRDNLYRTLLNLEELGLLESSTD